jgi:hypothetical protein
MEKQIEESVHVNVTPEFSMEKRIKKNVYGVWGTFFYSAKQQTARRSNTYIITRTYK